MPKEELAKICSTQLEILKIIKGTFPNTEKDIASIMMVMELVLANKLKDYRSNWDHEVGKVALVATLARFITQVADIALDRHISQTTDDLDSVTPPGVVIQ
jgi:hypothetical protein